MFWKKNDQKGSKLSGPRDIPEFVKKHIESTQLIDSASLPFLKTVLKNSDKGEKIYDIYIFDPSDAEAREIKVQNYETLKNNPVLVVAEGSYNETDKKVNLVAGKAMPKMRYFSEEEMLLQIEALKDPGSSVFFFVNAGTGSGGPLGRGCAIIKVNDTKEKKTKRYSIYGASVIDMLPTKTENKIFDSDKPQEIMKWVATSHKPRFC